MFGGFCSRDYVTIYSSGAFWTKSKARRSCLEFGLQVGPKIFHQVIPMGSDPALFFANLFCSFMNLNGWNPSKMLTMELQENLSIRTRFIDDLITINDVN